jgi:hypothetical protein
MSREALFRGHVPILSGFRNETFEFLLKFGKSSYRRKPVSSYFKMFWTPAPVPDPDPGFAGVTTKVDFQRSRNMSPTPPAKDEGNAADGCFSTAC